MKRILCLLSLLLTSASLTQAFTLCYLWEDKFHQPVGSTLAGQPGGTGTLWESVGPSGPGIQVVAGGLAVPGLPVPEGNRVRLAGLNGPGARAALGSNVTSGTLYYSLALRVADRGTLGPEGGVLAAFNNATGASQTLPAPLAARLLVRSSGGGYQIGLSKSSANGADFVWASPTFSTNDIVFVVAGYEFRDGADTAFLWLNPPATSFGQSNAPPPTLTSSAGVDVANLQSFVLLQRPQPIHPAVTWVDEARVGTIWASVTPPPWDQFCTDFAQGLPAGTTATGTTPPAVVDGALHLTDAVNEQANYWTTRLTRQRVQSVSARWRTLIGGGTAPGADGLSFNLGYELGTAFLPEEGAGHGLSVSIDTWENASQEVGLEIKWNGQRVGFTRVGDGTTSAQAPLRSNQWVETELSVSPAGQVVFRYAGFSVAAQLPDYSGIDANEYAFAARTGGANDRHWIDDFCIRLTAGVCLDFATGLPAGTTAGGPNPPVVAAGVLHLTQALNDQSGYWITPVSRRIIQSASARWQALIGGGTTPGADGMSFNLGRDLGTSFVAEEGAVFGLSANVDTWDNGNGEVGIELKWNGQRIGFTRVGNGTTAAQAPLRPNQWVEAGLTLSPSGEATFRYADWSVSAQIPNYAGIDVDQYVFAARTGGANDRHCIDNFCLRLDERPQADLQVTLAPLPAQMAEGELLTITATASNAGPSTATRAEVTFSIPTGATLQSVTNDHGSCTVQGSNVTCTVNMLAAQQSFRVEAVAGVGPQFGGQTGAEFFDILIDISLTASEQDPNLDNNQVAVAVVVVPNLDFGDARAGYPVTRAENGARHRNGAIWRLGGAFDREPNGTHSANADYDDLTAVPDDEDGVTLPVPFLAGRTHTVMVTVPVAGMLDAFFDWNNDGDWLDAGERVTPPAGLPIGPGAVPVPIAVPLAAVNGSPHARFRFSDAGGLAPTGFHPVGEVEDYPVEVRRVDFGNAPDPSYPTLLANNGARHLYDPAWFMGALIDWEPDGPDSAPLVDEDGVVFAGPLVAGLPATVQVTASAAGFVDAFIDFNGDGDWLDAGERITPVGGTPVVAGPNPIPFTVPATATTGDTWARFRFSNAGGLASIGPANLGEVEDYQVALLPNPVAVFGGLEHVAGGNATVTPAANGLRVAGLGSSNDVVRVNLGRVEGWRADVASFENPGTLTLTTRGTIGGQSNQPLNSIRFERAGSNTVVSANFSGLGASQYRAEIYDRHGILLASRAPLGSGSSMFMRPCSDDAGNTGFQICWVAVFADSIYYVVCGDCITFDGGPGPIEGPITVKLSAVGATVRADYLSAVEIDGAAGTALTLANEAIQRGGHWHQFLGDAVLEAWPDDWEMPWFRVGNIGASGQDGLLTELGGAGALDVTLDPVDLNAAGRRLRIVATGRAGGVSGALAAVELVGSGQGSQLTVDLGALAGGYQLDAWDEARRTAGDLPQSSGSVMTLSPDANGAVRLEYFAVSKDSPDRLVVELEFAQTLTVTPVGFPAFRAKTVRITSVGPIESLGSVLQKWSGIGVVGVFFWGRDYGDAPEGYPVLLAEDGARHRRWPNWRLGANWDRDFVVAHSANADWDDLHNSFGLATATDDEDGVVFLATLGGILVQVTAAHDGYLNAWMDFNRDTDWADAGEHIIIDAALTAGVPRNFTITVPGGTTAGQFVSRWRLSETTGLSYTGYGGKGEVEDHVCQWEPEGPQYDFGDAPDAYQTLLASDGARHLVTAGWMIGTVIDAEADGLPAADADGDDLDGSDDEEGVNFTTGITPGAMATVEVSVTVPAGSTGYLNAWMDFGHNGTFADLDDHIIIDVPVMGGTYLVTANFPVPTTALPGFSYARFRLGPTAGLSYSGDGGAGEVEDYGFECDKLDFGDAPDSYRTTSAVDGARHVLFPQFCLGAVEDVESDGVPGASATGDDTSMPLGFDDEDGLSAATSLIPGSPATFDVYATIPGGTTGYLDAWADWNQDGDFDDANEQIAASHPLMNMLNIVGFNVPADALTGFTYVRLRLSSYGGLPSFGLASNGEVEDYRIEVVAAPGGVDLVVADPAPVEVIETGYFTSTITVSNKGPAAATSVRLISAIPAGVNVTSVSNSAGACQVQGSNIVCTVSSLPAQQSFSVTLTASPSPLPDDLASEFTDWSDWWWLADSSVEPESNPTDNRTRLAGVVFVRRDFGDAPHPSYATCLPGGARHRVVAGGGYCLGLLIDHEADCQPDDNLFNLADEDGVTFAPAPPWLPGTVVTPTVVVTRPAGTAARLDAWFDADGVAGFHPADRIYTGLLLLVIGPNVLPPFTVPATAPTGGTWLRFRLSQAGVAGPGGYAPNGEVEDYSVNILAPPVKFAGLLHSPLGGATLSASSNGLLVSNLGASGQDGVSIALQELSRAVTLGFGPAGLALPGGASRLSFSAVGMVNDVPERSLGKVSLQRHNGMMELAFDPATRPSVAMLRAEVYHQGALVGTAPVPPGGVLGTLVGDAALVGVVLREAPPGNTTEFIWWDFDFLAPVRFQSAGSAGSFTGNRIRLVGVNADGGVLQNLARLEVTGVNLASLLIREVSAPWFQPRLRIAPIGQRLQLNLDTRTAVLQQAPTANGPWSDVVEGTNVIVIGNTDARRFFRARIPERVLELSAAAACDFGFLSLNYVCKRNILLLIADDVGIDQIPWYTNHHASTFPITISSTTPNPSVSLPTLDKLAASGVTFVNAWSSPLCSPTRACLYTGQRSWRHGVFNALGTSGGLPVGTKTIANVLRDEGYANGLFGKWHCGEDTTLYTDPLGPPHEFGWDDHAGALGGGLGSYDPPYWNSTAVYRKVVNGTAVAAAEYATTENVNDALTWIGARTGPWMATVAFNAAHSPWASPPAGCEYQARSAANNRAYYRSMLECLDRSIAELLAGIDPDVLENTTVIFVGDNGTDESITEHFAAIRYGGTSHAKGSLYEGGINVPLVIADGYTFLHGQESPWTKGRGRVVSPGRIETSIVQTMDLFATAADIGRGDKSSGPDSVSLLPYLQSATAPAQRSYMSVGIRPDGWAFGDPGWDVAYRGECYKLIIRDLLSSSGETYELYDLTADRWESNDLNDGSLTLAEAYALLLDCP